MPHAWTLLDNIADTKKINVKLNSYLPLLPFGGRLGENVELIILKNKSII